jgi:hypothetical protein
MACGRASRACAARGPKDHGRSGRGRSNRGNKFGKTKCPPPWQATGISTLFEVSLLLVAALVTGLAKQLAVLLLGHTLATLLDN